MSKFWGAVHMAPFCAGNEYLFLRGISFLEIVGIKKRNYFQVYGVYL